MYLSVLERAIHTGHIVLSELKTKTIYQKQELAIKRTTLWSLLQGLLTQETREKCGGERVALETFIRRDALQFFSEEEAAKQAQDPRQTSTSEGLLPQGETLKPLLDRVLPLGKIRLRWIY